MNATVTFCAGERALSGEEITHGGRTHALDERGSVVLRLPPGEQVFEAKLDGEVLRRTITKHGSSVRFVVDFDAPPMEEHPFPDLVGLVGDRFRIDAVVARATTGTVVQAYDRQTNRPVALRSPSDELSAREEANQVFLVEARNLVALEHPNLLNIYEVLAVRGRGILVTEWVTGETLDQRMREGRHGRDSAWDVVLPLASAVSQLHREDIVHRDLHSANVIVRSDGAAKLIDLGLARSLADVYLGAARVHDTREHYAPEQFQGLHVTPSTDVYQLTMLFYRLWSGRWPYDSDDLEWAHVHEEAQPLPDAPERLQAIVAKGLEKEGRRRFVDAGELFRALTSAREQMDLEREVARQESSRWSIARLAAIAIALMVAGGAAAFYVTQDADEPVELEGPLVEKDEANLANGMPLPAKTERREVIPAPAEDSLGVVASEEVVSDVEGIVESLPAPVEEKPSTSGPINNVENVTKTKRSKSVSPKVDAPKERSASPKKKREPSVEAEPKEAAAEGDSASELLHVTDEDSDSIFLPVE